MPGDGRDGRIEAVLGPTNTGKTHYAIERMLAHRSGIIGLPLRLLAREVYDRVVAARGAGVAALVTGEERIVPDSARYWICTVEAMPDAVATDFLAVDEIQLCADPERGHVFTDRLLRARGILETLFLGSDTMRSAIAALVPGVVFQHRSRMSELTHVGQKKLSRMPPRSAIVGFSVENVYAIAEVLRRQKGGAAVVMGALSPRTRNAQVDLYQNGEVDYLVATDAIGMGLNLDIQHVAFSGLSKFDGRRMRNLQPNELAQIAGRAGRHTQNGTFGVTGEAHPLSDDLALAITENRFAPVKKLQWRNARLDFGTADRLVRSLETQTDNEWLTRTRDSDDLLALKGLMESAEVRARLRRPEDVRLLWDVCRIPDFRGISQTEHTGLLEVIFGFLHDGGRIPADWMDRQVRRIDRADGDIDALSKRLAYIRTWTYVAQRQGWLDDESHWREVTRAVEDRLSDALHAGLTQRFVDRRTSVLLRRLKQKESLVAEVNDKGEVIVEGHAIGRLDGFRFIQDKTQSPDEARTLRQAGLQALAPHFHLRADRFYNAPDTEIDYTEQGGLMWGDTAVGKLVTGGSVLSPKVQAFVDEEAGEDVAQKVERRLQHFVDRKVATLFEPLLALKNDETLTGLARGFAFRLVEANGILPRDAVAQEVKSLDQDARGALRKHGIRFGQFTVFLPLLLKPAPTRLRLLLWSLAQGLDEFPESPPPGLVTVPVPKGAPVGYDAMAGYRAAGTRAIRIDMLERLADMLRSQDSRAGFEATPDMLSITGMTLDQFADLMQGLGYRADRAERPKRRPAAAAAAPAAATAGDAAPAETLTEDAASAEAPVAEAAPAEALAAEAAPADLGAADAAPVEALDAEPLPAEAAPADEGGFVPVLETEDVTAEPGADAGPDVAGDAETGADPVGETPTAEAAAEGPVEVEAYYTFVWAPKRRDRRPEGQQGRGDRGDNRGEGRGERDGQPRRDGRKFGGKPQGQGDGRNQGQGQSQGKPQGGKPKGKRPPREEQPAGPKTFTARPPRHEKPIDPDNPFAAALMGLRAKT